MKKLLIVFVLIFSAWAQASTTGSFQIENSQSVMVLFNREHKITGSLEIQQDFSKSSLSVDSQASTFESTEFSGNLSDIIVKGYLTHQGTTRLVTLKGKYFGVINNEFGKVRVAFSFTEDNMMLRIFATKPSETATALHHQVREIVRH